MTTPRIILCVIALAPIMVMVAALLVPLLQGPVGRQLY